VKYRNRKSLKSMHVKLLMSVVISCSCLFLTSCSNLNADLGANEINYQFAGDWEGNGVDSAGNEFTFAAKVIALGEDKYRMLVLDKLDTQKKPMHVMDGVLKNNKFPHTADGGVYVGGGVLDEEKFEGYYKGPYDGTYKMYRVK
jgi:hypothetical protein